MKETVQWTAPSPLWEQALAINSALNRRKELSRPSILRFATDSFMDDFLKMLATDPKKLDNYVALPETWRGFSPLPDAIETAPVFARNFKRLGIISRRKLAKRNGLTQTPNKFTQFGQQNADKPLKLYQPAHQRFYLITASLVCERPGLLDKTLNEEREEKVSYVIRRLFPPTPLNVNQPLPPLDSTWQEYAFVATENGSKWIKTTDKKLLENNEEQQPLFAVNFTEDDGRRRKLYSAVIPAGKREAFVAAGKAERDQTGKIQTEVPLDPRVYQMRSQFRDPWKSLLQAVSHTKSAMNEQYDGDAQPDNVKKDLKKGSREQVQTASWLILLDFANFLADNLPRVWDFLMLGSVTPNLNTNEEKLVKAIADTKIEPASATDLVQETPYSLDKVKLTLKQALTAVRPQDETQRKLIEKNLENVAISYKRNAPDVRYPTFLFPLADVNFSLKTKLDNINFDITPTVFETNDFSGEDKVNRIAQLVEAALPPMPANQPLRATPLASQTPMDMREGWYVMRCVYERPFCGTFHPPVLSDPTKPFQIAGFFDPDAPARPIRISLPIDPTPAGLRKFDKNTAFMMSDLLCGQVNRMKGITFGDLIRSVLPFPLHKDLSVPDAGGCKDGGGLSIGMMCSLSIPIITICALILLMIIVALLDFIFRWLPFFIICFPLPGLKSKNE